ncbi:MAG TPA: response regulator [Methylomirabilota bacterium]|nr:response regulator [Methylomirabilota bacterium]
MTSTGSPAPGSGGRTRVLVCDDDERVRESVTEMLATQDFEVETAERAVDAIQKVMRGTYQVLLLDLKLPGLGGLDAISVVRRFDERLPIIVMTGNASFETEQAVRAAGVFYYLVKPFRLDELTQAVRAAARFRESARRRG